VFLLAELPAWHSNRRKRLIKTPKLHMGDTGLACELLGVDTDGLWQDRGLLGHLLETFAFQELRRQASGSDLPVQFFHFRDRDGYEVDIVLDAGSAGIAGVEVKAGATVRRGDFKGLNTLRDAAGPRFVGGVSATTVKPHWALANACTQYRTDICGRHSDRLDRDRGHCLPQTHARRGLTCRLF